MNGVAHSITSPEQIQSNLVYLNRHMKSQWRLFDVIAVRWHKNVVILTSCACYNYFRFLVLKDISEQIRLCYDCVKCCLAVVKISLSFTSLLNLFLGFWSSLLVQTLLKGVTGYTHFSTGHEQRISIWIFHLLFLRCVQFFQWISISDLFT